MLYVKTKIRPSKIHGNGLFADQPIMKGAVIWKFTAGFDQKFNGNQILKLPSLAQIYLSKHAYRSKKSKLCILPTDDAKYFNHSVHPNSISQYKKGENEDVTYAIRNIKTGRR